MTFAAPAAARAYLELTKPRIVFFVGVSAAAGALIFGPAAPIQWAIVFHASLGAALAAAGSLALNQAVEGEPDARMVRTMGRPVPSGRLSSGRATVFGGVVFLLGVAHLAYWLGSAPAFWATLSALIYVGAYTPLKKVSAISTLVGAVPGALPLLIGASTYFGWDGWRGEDILLVGSILWALYLWQMVHVLALGWNLRQDYARASLRLIPGWDARGIGLLMVASALLLTAFTAVPGLLMRSSWVAAAAAAAGAGTLLASALFLRRKTPASCRAAFIASLLFHPIFLGVLAAGALAG